ncbi:hypothetical protein BURK2_00934 [Burkholderiales bacterium]|nr:MAG: hypothetical protein F9K47_17685 [Burkholderiales bacterium]CAG0964650.1 hypothetical protein BURK2_00934 [Burkholderiales bacterium]
MNDFGLGFGAFDGAGDTGTMVIAVVAIALLFGTPLLMVLSILWYKLLQARRVHETIRILAEKGLPIPPELLPQGPGGVADRRRGILLVAVGAGLYLFLILVGGPWGLAAIPLAIGCGYLITAKIGSGNPS